MANEIPQLSAQPREKTGSRYARRLRDEGRLPGVVYGHGEGAVSISLDEHAVEVALHSGSQLFNLEVGGNVQACLVKDVQYDHLGKLPVHLDLARVDLSEEVEVEVYFDFTHAPEDYLEDIEGAVINHEMNELTVKCRADSIPENIEVDQSSLTLDTPITVADLQLPEGVKTDEDPERVVASVTIVAAAPEPEEDEDGGDEGAEPEVIGKDGDDDKNEDDNE